MRSTGWWLAASGGALQLSALFTPLLGANGLPAVCRASTCWVGCLLLPELLVGSFAAGVAEALLRLLPVTGSGAGLVAFTSGARQLSVGRCPGRPNAGADFAAVGATLVVACDVGWKRG